MSAVYYKYIFFCYIVDKTAGVMLAQDFCTVLLIAFLLLQTPCQFQMSRHPSSIAQQILFEVRL